MSRTTSSIIRSLRLRTLPLSLAGSLSGLLLAATESHLSAGVAILTLLTTALLQCLSNMSNELGDWLSGLDREERKGPQYSLQSGTLTEHTMRLCIGMLVILCCASGAAMTWLSFGTLLAIEPILVLLLGAAAIWAAMHYTLGRHPYGYHGLGDISVFVFFGLVPVLGARYVASHQLTLWPAVLPAIAIGCFSIGVLNVNNIRDMISDREGGRITVAMQLGTRRARIYHTLLIITGWMAMLAYTILTFHSLWNLLYVVTLPFYVIHLRGVWSKEGRALDPMLPMLVLSTFAFSLLSGIGLLI